MHFRLHSYRRENYLYQKLQVHIVSDVNVEIIFIVLRVCVAVCSMLFGEFEFLVQDEKINCH